MSQEELQRRCFDMIHCSVSEADVLRFTELVAARRSGAVTAVLVIPECFLPLAISAGLDINARDTEGETAIFKTRVFAPFPVTLRPNALMLVRLGARIRIRNAAGRTPFEARMLRRNPITQAGIDELLAVEARVLRCSRTALALEAGMRAWRLPRDVRRLVLHRVGESRCDKGWF
jgi:hypothetical protein